MQDIFGELRREGFSIIRGFSCGPMLARASRDGIIVTLCFHVWAAVHSVLGAIGLGRQMQAAAEAGLAAAAAPSQVSSR